jgi:hypothetical protein
VLFEGTPEEFKRVEAMFRAATDPGLQPRSIALPLGRPKAWPELGEEHAINSQGGPSRSCRSECVRLWAI